jgi:hypothetical protein
LSAREEQDPVRSLAERIASRLATGDASDASREPGANVGDELAALRASVSEIGQRLTRIESHVTGNNAAPRPPEPRPGNAPGQAPSQIHTPHREQASAPANDNSARRLSGTYVPAVHPSDERFGIDEAVSELVEFFEREKTCNVEPGGKPCDHCGMCSSRGF